MSLNTFSTELKPEIVLRRIVIVYGISATLVGLALISTLGIAFYWRCATALVWTLLNTRQLNVIARGHKHCRLIRIRSDGTVSLLTPDGCWISATILGGSVVSGKFAWLRFEAENGQHFAELLRQKWSGNKDWRRLRVIWRHLGAGG